MSKFLHLYNSAATFEADYNGEAYKEPWVSYTREIPRVDYNKPDPANGHCYVDLGLPSGTLWACTNIGAENPEDLGDDYAWGETEPYVEGETYKFGSYPFTKYNSTDGKDTLDLEDDAARVQMGGEWHMPTLEQCYELMDNTTREVFDDYVVFTSNINGNQITIPFCGNAQLIWLNRCSVDPNWHHTNAWMLVYGCEGSYTAYIGNETDRNDDYNQYVSRYQVRGVLGDGPEREDLDV